MTSEQGTERLIFHSCQLEDGAFLYMLRPYRGLRDEILADVMEALHACAPKLAADHVPQRLVSALWAISRLGRLWALEPGGMLRRNRLISDADQEKLSEFLEGFDLEVESLLEGVPESEA